MGQGIEMARVDNPEHAEVMENFRDQLIIVIMKRLKQKYGDDLVFSLRDVDDTGQDMLAFKIDEQKNFVFVLEKKS